MKTITQQTKEGVLYWNSFLSGWQTTKVRLQEWKAKQEFESLQKNFPELQISLNDD